MTKKEGLMGIGAEISAQIINWLYQFNI